MSEQSNSKDLVKSYSDKVYDAFKETGKSINQVLFLLVFLSFVIMSLSFGIISVGQELSIFNLKFIIPSWLILIGGSAIITVSYVYFVILSKVNRSLQYVLSRFYAYDKFEINDIEKNDTLLLNWNVISPNLVNFVGYVSIISAVTDLYEYSTSESLDLTPRRSLLKALFTLSKDIINIFALALIGILFLIFPIAAQIAAGVKMLILFNEMWWVWVSFSFFIIISIGYFISFITNLFSYSIDELSL